MLAQPKFAFVLEVTLAAFILIFPVALLVHFLHLRHYLYAAMPFFIKGTWVLLATFFIAEVLVSRLGVEGSDAAFVAALPATLCFIPLCFTVVEHIVPDLVTSVVRGKEWLNGMFGS